MKLGLGHFVDRAMYQDYLRRLDVRAVLSHYGAENQREEPGADGTTEVIHSCLLDKVDPHHAHGDSNPSAAANIEKKLFICYSYWAGDLIQLIMRMEGKDTVTGVLPVPGAFLGETTESAEDITAEIDTIFAAAESEYQPPPPVYLRPPAGPWAVVHPTWRSGHRRRHRLPPQDQLARRRQPDRDPALLENRLVGWQARTVPRSAGAVAGNRRTPSPRYKSSFSFPKSSTLYNYDQARTQSVRGGRVPVLGDQGRGPRHPWRRRHLRLGTQRWSRFQHDLLAGFDRVTVWMDGDTAGRGAERRIVRALARRVDLVRGDTRRGTGSRRLRDAEIESSWRQHVLPGCC